MGNNESKQAAKLFLNHAWFGNEREFTSLLLRDSSLLNKQNEFGNNALIRSSWRGHIAIVNILVQHKPMASLDLQNKDGWAALTNASICGHVDVARVLLLNGCALNTCSKDGNDALSYAKEWGRTAIVALIEEEGRWRRRRSWVMFSSMFKKSLLASTSTSTDDTSPSGDISVVEKALAMDEITRIISGFL
jgi:ankyrin repeat protein